MNLDSFQQAVKASGRPLVVDFWAPWCAPCRASKPILEKLAAEYAGRVDFLAVNADESRELLASYRVRGIPTVLALRDGQEAARVSGAQPESGYRQLFEALAAGQAIKIPLAPFERMLRLGTGALLAAVGFASGSWVAVVAGGVVAFLGIYDRCPVWAALSGLLKKT